jgi:DNA mismatch repair protein MutS2
VTLRGGRYVIPVRRDARARPDGIIHDESGSSGTLFVEPTAAIELGNALRSAVLAEERAILAVLRDLTSLLRPERTAMVALHAMAVELDTLAARAHWAFGADAEVPSVVEVGGPLRLVGARHPLLLARGVDAVPFDLALEGAERTLLISGPNTGGKTVLLKTTGLAIALTQSGVVPPLAPGSVVPMVTAVMVDIGDHQSIAADLSTFSAHVAALRSLLARADHGTLVILDEMGSGTDPSEGGALASAVLEELTRRGALTLATTHLGALKSLATRIPGVVNGSLHFDAATLSPTYRFTKGIPGRSYGLAIARRLGVDATVLATAEALVPEAERELDRLLATVEARDKELRFREQEATERLAALDLREARSAAREAEQAERGEALDRAEREAARERGRAAKAYLLEARKRVEEALALARGAADEAAAREARRLVEEGIRAEASGDADGMPAQEDPGAALVVGAPVRLVTGATGEVVELRADGRAVVQVGAMRLVVKRATLTVLRDRPRGRPAPPPRGDAPALEANSEVDLRGLRVDEALTELAAALDVAVLAELPVLRIIHGMGTGAVREAVQQALAGDRRVASHEFAPRAQGGTGVTLARLR